MHTSLPFHLVREKHFVDVSAREVQSTFFVSNSFLRFVLLRLRSVCCFVASQPSRNEAVEQVELKIPQDLSLLFSLSFTHSRASTSCYDTTSESLQYSTMLFKKQQ
jgi:hypothetical protein